MERRDPHMKILRGILASVFLFALAATLSAQSFLVRTYEETDGLLNTAVNGVAQDDAGRMWFTSRGGITVYDGARWATYTTSNGLSALSAFQIRRDGRGAMWVIGQNPAWVLMRFDGSAWTSFALPMIENRTYGCTALAVQTEGDETLIAVGTSAAGVFLFDGSRWTNYSSAVGLPGDAVRGLEVLEDGFVAATNKGLAWVGRNGVERRWKNVDPMLDEDVRGVAVEPADGGAKIWLLGKKALGLISGGRFERVLKDAQADYLRLRPEAILLPDHQGDLFIGIFTSIRYYDSAGRSTHPLGIASGLIAEGATALLEDREGDIWITGARGVSRISSHRFFNYRKIHGLLDNEVSAIRPFGDKGIAFGHNNGISILQNYAFRHVVFERKADVAVGDVRVLDMSPDENGGLWVAGGGLGLGYLNRDGRFRWIDFPLGPTETVTSVLAVPGHRVWVARNDRLFLWGNGRMTDVTPAAFRDVFIRKLAPGPRGSIYVTTSGHGFFKWDENSWTQFTNTTDPGAANVYAVLADSNGRVLAGTIAGLYVISGGGLSRFVENGFEIRRPIYLLLEDKAGRIWLGTDNGVIRWDGRTRRDYSKAEGLAGREVNRAAGWIDDAGRIWIGTNDGVSLYNERFDPEPETFPPPLIAITTLDVNGKKVDFSEELSLGYRQNNLVFHFIGTSFLDENRLRFESRLDGFDPSWSPEYAAADRQIRYTNLPPGTYVFHLRAKNAIGTISREVISPAIHIHNPFWLQWWFIASALLLGGTLILSLGLAVTQHRQAERLEALVLDRTAQIQTSLREKEILLKEIHHRVKNNLQIISSLLYLQSRRIADPGVLSLFQGSIGRIRAMALVHESLYRSDRLTAIVMEDYFRKLADHLIESYSGRDRPVTVSIRAGTISLPLETAVIYGLIVNELVTNALKHAFPGNRKGRIEITMSRAEEAATAPAAARKGGIVLSVFDDGIGLPEEKKGGAADSLGLRLVANLAGQLDGTIEVRNDGGTEIRILFPE